MKINDVYVNPDSSFPVAKCKRCGFAVLSEKIDDKEYIMKAAAKRYKRFEEHYAEARSAMEYYKKMMSLASDELKSYLLAKRL